MTALTIDVRELSFDEIDCVAAGAQKLDGNGLTPSQNRAAIGCMSSLAAMGVMAVAGVAGPVAWFGFGMSAVGAWTSCRG
jgi:hypothetical protein